ncbi:putative damage-inducible protein DinB [Bacillus sp. SORGH_AS 510]|uniref:DinB family protein n=1 Tax=Bacillus sp. SORGH_AS_0510 TaxID=3041771 RepID=UPI00277E43B5|nr:DinB family protein [Bacillus sp. SORGH_AS_0510]MDQ1147597.1 putative damage-inducible protein DinB [Bacillus sp. SORGH_AS_0510]
MLQRPLTSEYPEYYVPYVDLVPEGDLLTILNEDLNSTIALFEGISNEEGHFRYATDKWSIKEVLGHMTDTERIMSYRLLRIGRGDQTALAGFNENEFVEGSQINNQSINDILEDFVATRKATITLIKNMPVEAWSYKGNANNTEVTARAIGYIIAGHAIHHKKIIKERYLSAKNR